MKAQTLFFVNTQKPYLFFGVHYQFAVVALVVGLCSGFLLLKSGYMFLAFLSVVGTLALAFFIGMPFSKRNPFFFAYIMPSLIFWLNGKNKQKSIHFTNFKRNKHYV